MKSPIRFHGGKSYLARKIIDLFPPRDTWHLYREPFFGGGSVLFGLYPEGISEAVNDIDCELWNFWDVLRNPSSFELFIRKCEATPLSELDFSDCKWREHAREAGAVCRAWRFFVRCRQSRQGLGKDFATPTSRLRRGMNENVSAWLSAVDGLPDVHERLRRVEIRNMPAVDFIRKYDHPKAVFYCDPPYLHETRSTGGGEYRHEMSRDDHMLLLECLSGIKGRFLLSGYPSDLYETAAKEYGWRRVDLKTSKPSSGKKIKPEATECVWMNFNCL